MIKLLKCEIQLIIALFKVVKWKLRFVELCFQEIVRNLLVFRDAIFHYGSRRIRNLNLLQIFNKHIEKESLILL